MAKASTLSLNPYHRVLIYGAPKTGKSTLAAELAEHYNLIWVDLENGHDVVFKLPMEQMERIEVINLPDTRSYPIAAETCLKMVKANTTPIKICEVHGKVNCTLCPKNTADYEYVEFCTSNLGLDTVVVFDSMTQLTNSLIAHITKNEKDDYKLDYDDWGNLGKLLDIFLSHIQQAKYHVIVISHETDAKLEEKGKTKLVPVAGTRNYSRNCAKFFDHVVYTQIKNGRHNAASTTTYHNTILTGSRTDAVLEEDSDGNPTLMRIFRPQDYPAPVATQSAVTKTTSSSSVLKGLVTKKAAPKVPPTLLVKPNVPVKK